MVPQVGVLFPDRANCLPLLCPCEGAGTNASRKGLPDPATTPARPSRTRNDSRSLPLCASLPSLRFPPSKGCTASWWPSSSSTLSPSSRSITRTPSTTRPPTSPASCSRSASKPRIRDCTRGGRTPIAPFSPHTLPAGAWVQAVGCRLGSRLCGEAGGTTGEWCTFGWFHCGARCRLGWPIQLANLPLAYKVAICLDIVASFCYIAHFNAHVHTSGTTNPECGLRSLRTFFDFVRLSTRPYAPWGASYVEVSKRNRCNRHSRMTGGPVTVTGTPTAVSATKPRLLRATSSGSSAS